MADSTYEQTHLELPDTEKERLIRLVFSDVAKLMEAMKVEKEEAHPAAYYWKNTARWNRIAQDSIETYFVRYFLAMGTLYGVDRQTGLKALSAQGPVGFAYAVKLHQMYRDPPSPARSESSASSGSQGSSIGSDMMFRMDREVLDDGSA